MKEINRKSSAGLRCRSLLVLLSQTGLIVCSLVLAWLLRFEFTRGGATGYAARAS